MAARFSVLSNDGVYVSGWPRGSTHSSWFPFFFDADGRVINQTLQDGLVRYELSGSIVDTIDVPGSETPIPRIEIVTANSRTSFYVPFAPGNHWGVTRNGSFIHGFGGEYRFEWTEADGTVVRVERESQGALVAPEEAARMREDYTQMIRSEYGVPDWQWNGPDIPTTKPAFDRILPGRDGTVWLLRATVSKEVENPNWNPEQPEFGAPTQWVSSTVADVFDEEGRYLGPVKFPDGMVWQTTLPVLTQDAVWALAPTPIGVPQVVRFRLEPAGGL
jgi:hypothetical protein